MLRIPPTDYTPDMPSFNNPGSNNIINCLPRTPDSYGPFPSLSNFGTALPSATLGAFTAVDPSDNNYIFTGTQTDLYEFTGTTPTNVSKSTGAYSTPSGERWRYLQFGSRVLATNYGDPIQQFPLTGATKFSDLANGTITAFTLTPGSGYTNGTYALTPAGGGSGTGFSGTVTVAGGVLSSTTIGNGGTGYSQSTTFAVPAGAGSGTGGVITPTISTIAPKARYLAAVRGFCVAANTFDATNGAQPQRVWWSALNNPLNWPTPGTNNAAQFQSSYNDLYGDGGFVQGIVGGLGGADGAVFLERQVYIMTYEGPPQTFNFYPAEGVRGTPAPKSIVQVGGLVYYLGVDGFYVFDGSNSTPIGANKVDKTFYSLLDQNYLHRVDGTFDPINKIVYWAFPAIGNIGGNPNMILAFNWQLGKWSIIQLPSPVETIFNSLTFGYTIDTLPYATLDAAPYPFDSRVWTGGNQILTGFDTTHTLSYFNGPSLAATIETGEKQPFPGEMTYIQNTRPLVDTGGNAVTLTVAVATRNKLSDPPVYGSAATMTPIGTCPLMANGLYVKALMTISAGAIWTHCLGLEVEGVSNGVQG